MNYHNDEWIINKIHEHYNDALKNFPEDKIVGIFLQGSQNYGLDYKDSDVDTKLIVLPSAHDLIMDIAPISKTYIRDNDEHIDFKDLRQYFQIFRKQNMNFIEILFTPYCIVNEKYKSEWNKLIEAKEKIARYSFVRSIKAMVGVAKEKYFAMEHHYPTRMHMIKEYGFDPKQLHHLIRVHDFIKEYINGNSYADCLIAKNPEWLVEVKSDWQGDLEYARELGKYYIDHIEIMYKDVLENNLETIDPEVDVLFNEVQYNIVKTMLTEELSNDNRKY